jgi:hypothetical protein
MSDVPVFDVREQVARIDRMLEESGKQSAERLKLDAERLKLESERMKLEPERGKLDRGRTLAPWAIVTTAMGAGAALFAAGATFFKFFG